MQYFHNVAFSSRFPNWHEMGIYEQAIWRKVVTKEWFFLFIVIGNTTVCIPRIEQFGAMKNSGDCHEPTSSLESSYAKAASKALVSLSSSSLLPYR